MTPEELRAVDEHVASAVDAERGRAMKLAWTKAHEYRDMGEPLRVKGDPRASVYEEIAQALFSVAATIEKGG